MNAAERMVVELALEAIKESRISHPDIDCAIASLLVLLDRPKHAHPGTLVGRIATDEEMRHRDPRWGRVIWMPEASIVDKFPACDLYAVRPGAQR